MRRIPTYWAWLTARDWWRYQTVLAAAGLMLAATALLGAASSYIDDRDDSETNADLRRVVERLQFEQECRFQIADDVVQIESDQLDGFTDLLGAVALRDRQAMADTIHALERLKTAKAEANVARSKAVDTCNRRAENLGFKE